MSHLFITAKSNSLFIQGDKKLLNKRVVSHLKRKYDAEQSSGCIVINRFKENENLISELVDYFNKKSIPFEMDTKVDSKLSKLYQEEIDFEEFSFKAKEIWNNNVDNKDFKAFKESLRNKMIRTLYPLQLLSSFHLAFSQNACNFSVPGAGKTSVVYGAFSYLNSLNKSNSKHVDKILVIGPLSSFGPWESEYEECFGVSVNSKRIAGNAMSSVEKKEYFLSKNTADLTLISYQGVISQRENMEFFLKNNSVMVVLDEAHKIKNTDGGQIAEGVLSLANFCNSRVVLTGTPAPNGYRDLYNLFSFVWPRKNLVKFSKIQLDDMTKSSRDPRIGQLIDDLSPYFIRVKKSDLGLPPKKENEPIIVDMDPHQRNIYDTIENQYMQYFEAEGHSDNSFIDKVKKARMIRLIQAATNPKLLLNPIKDEYGDDLNTSNVDVDDYEFIQNILYYSSNLNPNKFNKALDLIKKLINKNQKVIVWAIFVDTIKSFHDYLSKNGIESKLLYGATPIENENNIGDTIETREKIIKDFHDSNSTFKVLIANPFAVAESISLHKACHNAIYLERNFDGARFVQSKDRIHRYGLDPDVVTNYYYLISRDSIDDTIHKRLLEKEELMIRVTESQDIPLFKNVYEETESDIKAMIKDYVRRAN